MYIKVFANISKFVVDMVLGWCYIYYDRRGTTVVTTAIVATTVVTILEGDRFMAEISSDVIRGYNDIIILYLLLSRPSYGYEISKEIRTLSEDKYIIKETTLYSAFTRMEKNGFIESFVDEDLAGGKKRTYYRLTEAGKEHYRAKCEEWKLTKEVIEKFIADEGAIV